jgi:hypothetical protein
MIGRVYKITNTDESIVYIGSTTSTLQKRWGQHKSAFIAWLEGREQTSCSIYKHFEYFGFDTFTITQVSEHVINNRNQLREFEQLVIDSTDCVNQQRAIQTEAELQEYQHQYYVSNAVKLQDYQKRYRNANRERVLARKNEKLRCDCGSTYSRDNKARHMRSKKHLRWMEEQT